MDHAEAIAKGAVERYQLGELSENEIGEFETHFFECAHCADELRAAAIFEENAKAVFLENSRSAAGAGEPWAKYVQAVAKSVERSSGSSSGGAAERGDLPGQGPTIRIGAASYGELRFALAIAR